MYTLLVVQVLFAVAALAMGVAVRPRRNGGELLAEVVMVLAMTDVHLAWTGVISAPAWAVALGACALGVGLRHRLQRDAAPTAASDGLHPLGMLIGAALVLLSAAPTHATGSHAHGGADLLVATSAALVAYAAVVVVRAMRLRRIEVARALASLGGLLVMGVMVAVG